MNYFRHCKDPKIANRWFEMDEEWCFLIGDMGLKAEKFNDFFG